MQVRYSRSIPNSWRLFPSKKTSSDMNVLIWLKCGLFGQGCEEEEKIFLSPKNLKVFYRIISYKFLSILLPSKH